MLAIPHANPRLPMIDARIANMGCSCKKPRWRSRVARRPCSMVGIRPLTGALRYLIAMIRVPFLSGKRQFRIWNRK